MTAIEVMRAGFDPRGRCNRKGLLYLAVILLTVQVGLGVLVLRGVLEQDGPLLLAMKIVFFWTAYVGASKRLHDTGRRAWWIAGGFLALAVWTIIATVGALIVFDTNELVPGARVHSTIVMSTIVPAFAALLWLHCRKGMTGPNRFGPQPGQSGFSLPAGQAVSEQATEVEQMPVSTLVA